MIRKTLEDLLVAIMFIGIVFTSPAMADQITLDIPDVAVTVTRDADGYARFSFTDERIQFITKAGEPVISWIIQGNTNPFVSRGNFTLRRLIQC